MKERSRWWTWLGIVGVAGVLAYTLTGGHGGGPPKGSVAPAFSAPVLGGTERFDSASAAGHTMVLDFWATWCPPCVKSLPALQRVHTRYREVDDVVVLSVNTDVGPRRPDRVGNFMKARRFDFPVLLDDGAVSAAYHVKSIPTLVVVGPDGRVSEVEIGARFNSIDDLERHLVETIEAARE